MERYNCEMLNLSEIIEYCNIMNTFIVTIPCFTKLNKLDAYYTIIIIIIIIYNYNNNHNHIVIIILYGNLCQLDKCVINSVVFGLLTQHLVTYVKIASDRLNYIEMHRFISI